MNERSIVLNEVAVRAVLKGSKTQMRVAIKPQPYIDGSGNFCWNGSNFGQNERGLPCSHTLASQYPSSKTKRVFCPFGKVGDRLWVRETWQLHSRATDVGTLVYRASRQNSWTEMHQLIPAELTLGVQPKPFQEGWRRSTHMPRWASRIKLEITGVRVERLHDITRCDIQAEGLECPPELRSDDVSPNYRDWYPAAYKDLWNSNGGQWDLNPWVWVIEFKKL